MVTDNVKNFQFQREVIHIPRGLLRGEGVSQMTILLHKPVLVKATTKWGGGSKTSKNLNKWFMDDPIIRSLFKDK